MLNKIRATIKNTWLRNSDLITDRIRSTINKDRNQHGNGKKEQQPPSLRSASLASDREGAGWISPKYSQSRISHLDPGFIAGNRCLAYLDNVPEAEAYRVVRTQLLQQTLDTGANAIMVTSALPGEGKTLTAINLAFTLARSFQHTVMLVDGDLRKQDIHKYLGCPGEKGLIDYLAGNATVSELITWPNVEKITLISGGQPFQESAEMLGSPRMRELITDMKKRYPDRYIIFDAPPVLTGADVLTLAPLVDKVIIVVQAGKTSTEDVKKAVQFLPKEKILGFVLNRCQTA
jgi:non-specific protein-tyrosine kinase